MRVKLGITGGQFRQQTGDIGFVDARVLQKPEDSASEAQPAPLNGRTGARGQRTKNQSMSPAINEVPGGELKVQAQRVEGQPNPFEPELGLVLHQHSKYCGMQMQMQMAVDVVKFEPRLAKFSELR